MLVCEQPGCARPATKRVANGPRMGMALCDEHATTTPPPVAAPGYPPPTQPLPVSGFVLAMFLPIVGVFICREQMLQAQRTGRDNQLARAGFYLSIVSLAFAAAAIFIYVIVIVAVMTA